jgi:hypothetical protein
MTTKSAGIAALAVGLGLPLILSVLLLFRTKTTPAWVGSILVIMDTLNYAMGWA